MQLSFTEKKNIRKSFGKLKESLSIPNLIEVQKNSYKQLTEFKVDVEQQGCRIKIVIEADRFLRNMVRAIVGTLTMVGKGKMSIEEFQSVIDSCERSNAGKSSAINTLSKQNKLAFVSKQPGRTQLINFFSSVVSTESSIGPLTGLSRELIFFPERFLTSFVIVLIEFISPVPKFIIPV